MSSDERVPVQSETRNRGGRPKAAERDARNLARARGDALQALRRAAADPETPASSLPQIAREIRELIGEMGERGASASVSTSELGERAAKLLERRLDFIEQMIAEFKASAGEYGRELREAKNAAE